MMRLSYYSLYFMITWCGNVVLQAHIFAWNDIKRVYHIRFHSIPGFVAIHIWIKTFGESQHFDRWTWCLHVFFDVDTMFLCYVIIWFCLTIKYHFYWYIYKIVSKNIVHQPWKYLPFKRITRTNNVYTKECRLSVCIDFHQLLHFKSKHFNKRQKGIMYK